MDGGKTEGQDHPHFLHQTAHGGTRTSPHDRQQYSFTKQSLKIQRAMKRLNRSIAPPPPPPPPGEGWWETD